MVLIHFCISMLFGADSDGIVDQASGGKNDRQWQWNGLGGVVTVNFSEGTDKSLVQYNMEFDKERILLASDSMPPLSVFPGICPMQVMFAEKDCSTFAVFTLTRLNTVSLQEFSVPERKRTYIPASDRVSLEEDGARGNAFFYPTGLAKCEKSCPVKFTSIRREGERWLVTMKIGANDRIFYRADREALWHVQMDDEKDWLAKDPVMCGSAIVTIDGEERTVQLWNQIAVRQNVEQQLARYKIPDVNFTWLDLVNADGSARRIWDAPDDELTFGAKENCGLIACYDPFKKQIAFAFQDRFHAIEYYEASIGQDLPKTSVLSRTQSYIQRTDGRGASPGAARYGRHMFDHLSGVAMAQPESQPLVLLSLTPLSDRMRCEATVDEMVIILELKDGAEQWEYRLDLFRRIERKQP